ncbi:MAG: aspartate carbamoyltransferase [Ruminococcus sp.]|nr:aspartate carbamoyltransferase [Ruminococcus sp.]
MGYLNLLDLDDFPGVDGIIDEALEITRNPENFADKCKGKILATLFYEPSTRTQMSFQTAMLRLGGSIIGFDNPETSSVAKGENLKDTTKVVSSYADIMVMRNPWEGSALAASLTADCPIINAGDGGHLHPTQTLTDLLTLKAEKGHFENLTIGLCGDLKYGRTVHSFAKALCKYPGVKFILISTPSLTLPQYIKDVLKANGCPITETDSLEDTIPKLDVLYMTRIQRERFEDSAFSACSFCLDTKKMQSAKPDLVVLHPLPRVDEIEIAVDNDPRALYFKQAKYGVYVRMALILHILRNKDKVQPFLGEITKHQCNNKKCITQNEKYLPKLFRVSGDIIECVYCDNRILI